MKYNPEIPYNTTFSVCCAPHAEGTHPASEPCVERVSIETAENDVARDCIVLMEVMDKVRVSDATSDWEAMSVAAKRVADSAHRYAQARLAARRA